ncbi:MAG: Adenylosuccinate lyase [Elusimicrobia bacterium]|nr:Adenylosuccinate lyase [Elusimicrobiota bacterium]
MIPRYTRPAMSAIWSDENRYRIWLEIEILAAEALTQSGRVPKNAIATLRKKAKVNVKRILKIEDTVKHDVIAFLSQIEETVGPEARFLHMGLTSSDVVDTALAVQIKEAGELLEKDLSEFAATLKKLARKHKDTRMVGRSHGVHAEPITFGLKVAGWLAEARRNQERLAQARSNVAVGKLSGAVGTFAHNGPQVEAFVCKRLGLKPEPLATQVIPRDRHAHFLTTLAVIAGMLERIATELRHLQRTEVLEAEEPFSKGQKGSSAMPHKRNPIGSENICGLARLIRGNAMAALENIALWHERDISHSSVERVVMPDTTLLLDYALHRMKGILENLQVYPQRMRENLEKTQDFLATQSILLALVQKGLDRQKAYEMVQKNALEAWTEQKSFRNLIERDELVTRHLSKAVLAQCFDTSHHFRHVNTLFKRVGC